MPEPAGGVDARREPEADGALVDDRRIDVRDAHQRAQPGFCVRASARSPARAKARFSSTSGTTSAIVASPIRSACSSIETPSACASFATTPVPQSSWNG